MQHAGRRLDGTPTLWPFRDLANYVAKHREKHPDVVHARTLTEARRICFGGKGRRGGS
jgi:uncharacterized short protein YbdD (DUF466 family)